MMTIEGCFNLYFDDISSLNLRYNSIEINIQFHTYIYYTPIIGSNRAGDSEENTSVFNTRMFYFYQYNNTLIQKLMITYIDGDYFIEYGIDNNSVVKIRIQNAIEICQYFDSINANVPIIQIEDRRVDFGFKYCVNCLALTYEFLGDTISYEEDSYYRNE